MKQPSLLQITKKQNTNTNTQSNTNTQFVKNKEKQEGYSGWTAQNHPWRHVEAMHHYCRLPPASHPPPWETAPWRPSYRRVEVRKAHECALGATCKVRPSRDFPLKIQCLHRLGATTAIRSGLLACPTINSQEIKAERLVTCLGLSTDRWANMCWFCFS